MEASTSDDPNSQSHSYGADYAQASGEAPVDGDPLDHLWNAAHEMLRALRGLIEAADEFVETQRARPARPPDAPREGRVHHIDIDAPDDSARSDSHTDARADS